MNLVNPVRSSRASGPERTRDSVASATSNGVKSFHVAIDARMYGTAQRGIGRYLMKLIEGLEQLDSENEYTLFLRKENFEEYQPKNPHFKKAVWDAPWYGIREQLSFRQLFSVTSPPPADVTGSNYGNVRERSEQVTNYASEANKLPIDLVHFPHWNVPLFFNRPFIVTVHDLELFSSNRTRENSTRGRFVYWFKFQMFKIIFRHAVLAARAIIVPSQFIKEQLLDKYPKVRRRVHVIYEAATLDVTSPPPADVTGSNYGNVRERSEQVTNYASEASKLPEHFALYVGAAYPHKNLPRLLEAWNILHKEFPDHKLVLVGREDFFWKKLKSTSYILRPTSSIVFYGPATDEELAELYQNAALLVQPSLEEGFSLSPLEALSFGRPAAVSDIPVHREIYGKAVHYFDPFLPQSIAETIRATLKNPTSAPLPRVYSWLNHAKETKALYETQNGV